MLLIFVLLLCFVFNSNVCICSLSFIHLNRMQKGGMGGPGMGMKGGMG